MRVRLSKFRSLPALILLLVCTPLLRAQPASAPQTKFTFWKATSPTTTVYLLGSLHVGTPDMYPLPPEVEAAFDNSKILVVECDITKVNPMDALKMIQDKGVYTDGSTLDKNLTDATRAKLKKWADDAKMDTALVQPLKPWAAGMMVMALELQKLGFREDLGIDRHFLEKAKTRKIVELESADYQLKLISGFTPQVQDKWLASTLDSLATFKPDLDELTKDWATGDTAAMEKLINKDDDVPELKTKLLDERNAPMAQKIEALLKADQPAFVVVGAAHLLGDTGILKTLEKDKITTEQMPVTRPGKNATTQAGAKAGG